MGKVIHNKAGKEEHLKTGHMWWAMTAKPTPTAVDLAAPYRIKWTLSIQTLKDARKYYKLLLRLWIGVHMLSQHLHAA